MRGSPGSRRRTSTCALAEVLQAPVIGGFDEVTPILDEGLATVRRAIARFFDAKHREDLLLLEMKIEGFRARVECRIFHNGVDDTGKPLAKRRDETWTFEWMGRTWVRAR